MESHWLRMEWNASSGEDFYTQSIELDEVASELSSTVGKHTFRLDTSVIVEIKESGEPLTSRLTRLDRCPKEKKEPQNRLRESQMPMLVRTF